MIKTADILKKAKALSAAAAPLDTSVKNRAIGIMADELENSAAEILKANAKDVKNASGKISDVMLDRLRLDSARIKAMADGMRAVAVLPDPVGRVLSETKRENGLDIKKVSVPLGVVAIIYESRPNVTSDAAVLCFKSGNVCVLRSGKEAFLSASAVVSALKRGLKAADLSEDYINLVEDTSRGSANELMTATGLVDLLIPRGGKGLISACVENATVPALKRARAYAIYMLINPPIPIWRLMLLITQRQAGPLSATRRRFALFTAILRRNFCQSLQNALRTAWSCAAIKRYAAL